VLFAGRVDVREDESTSTPAGTDVLKDGITSAIAISVVGGFAPGEGRGALQSKTPRTRALIFEYRGVASPAIISTMSSSVTAKGFGCRPLDADLLADARWGDRRELIIVTPSR